jgi:hypothetical protein
MDTDNITDTDYECEYNRLQEMFPNAQFSICIDLEYMDELLTDKNFIIIKQPYTCYCYVNCVKNTDYFYIKGHMTYRHIIEQLIEQGLSLNCNHHFLEGFCTTNISDCQYEMVLGS